jgi:hypothetical protein
MAPRLMVTKNEKKSELYTIKIEHIGTYRRSRMNVTAEIASKPNSIKAIATRTGAL